MNPLQEYKNKNFKIAVQDFRYWHSAGKSNQDIAEIIHKEYRVATKKVLEYHASKEKSIVYARRATYYGHVLMFYGLAVECLIKAYIVKNKKGEITKTKGGINYIGDSLSTHNLNQLYEIAELPVNSLEMRYLRFLQRAVESGKYPFEKSPKENESYTGRFSEVIEFAKDEIKSLEKKLLVN